MGDWWCEKCQAYVSPESVTFNELHELCGYPVLDGPSPSLVEAESHIADLEAQLADRDKRLEAAREEVKVTLILLSETGPMAVEAQLQGAWNLLSTAPVTVEVRERKEK